MYRKSTLFHWFGMPIMFVHAVSISLKWPILLFRVYLKTSISDLELNQITTIWLLNNNFIPEHKYVVFTKKKKVCIWYFYCTLFNILGPNLLSGRTSFSANLLLGVYCTSVCSVRRTANQRVAIRKSQASVFKAVRSTTLTWSLNSLCQFCTVATSLPHPTQIQNRWVTCSNAGQVCAHR